jgi:hypothetical protein
MKKTRVEYIPRTKSLDRAVASIQTRMNSFKSDFEVLCKEDFETDHNLAGKAWVRLPDEGMDFVFFAGSYTVDTNISPTGLADFQVHFDLVANKIKSIYILLDEAQA